MLIRDRVRELRRVRAAELRPNPRNWRLHPEKQQNALRALLAEVGYVDALLARECPDGSLELIDGHLRAETTPDQLVPVLVLDLDEDEAGLVLATFDPLSQLAELDAERLDALVGELNVAAEPLKQMLAELTAPASATPAPALIADQAPAGDQSDQLGEQYHVLVECADEAAQSQLLARLTAEGFTCRALIA
jgi:hypothetical protein